MNSDKLIENLTGDLKPVKSYSASFKTILIWFAVSILWIVLLGIWNGYVKIDSTGVSFFTDRHITSFWAILTALSALAVGSLAAVSAFLLSIPGRKSRTVRIISIATLILWGILLVLGFGFEIIDNYKKQNVIYIPCFYSVVGFAILPTLLLIWLLRRNFTLKPYLAAIFASLAGLSIGIFSTTIYCADTRASHTMVSHFTALLLFPLIGLVFARFIDQKTNER